VQVTINKKTFRFVYVTIDGISSNPFNAELPTISFVVFAYDYDMCNNRAGIPAVLM
jgi:hypothetical protein